MSARQLLLLALVLMLPVQIATSREANVAFPVSLVCCPAEGSEDGLPPAAESMIAALLKQSIQFISFSTDDLSQATDTAVLWVQLGDGYTMQPAEHLGIGEFVKSGGALVITPAPHAGEAVFTEFNRLLAALQANARFIPEQTVVGMHMAGVGVQVEGLADIYLNNPTPIWANNKALTILQGCIDDTNLVWGVMERVGKGYVVVLGSAILSQDAPDDKDYDNLPFVTALINWLYEQATM